MESFAQLAPRSKLGDQRKIRKLGDDKRRHPVSNVDDSDVKLAAPVSRSNAPPVGKKTSKVPKRSDPSAIKKCVDFFSQHRVREEVNPITKVKVNVHYSPEPFVDSRGELFCECCREPLTTHKSTVWNHCACKKHKDNKQIFQQSGVKRQQILDSIVDYQKDTDVVGVKTLTDDERIFRHDVLFSFLSSLDPLESINHHRRLLEKHKTRITDATHLSDLIPLINKNELELLSEEFHGLKVCVIFDGAAHKGEAFAVIFRAVKDWTIIQRCVNVSLVASSMKGRNIMAELNYVVQVALQKGFRDVLCFTHDRAAPNINALTFLVAIYDFSFSMPCVSHTTDHVGDHLKHPNLNALFQPFNALFSHSSKALGLLERICGMGYPGVSTNRWWSTYECYVYIFVCSEGVNQFIREGILEDFTGS